MDQNQHITTATSLIPGQVYRVKAAFIDYDGIVHHIGETWRFVGKNFLPYEDGLTLEVEQDGQRQVIRLQWRPEAQEGIIKGFAGFVEAVNPTPVPQATYRAKRLRPWWAVIAITAAVLAGIVCLGAVGFFVYILKALEYKPSTINVDTAGITIELDAPISVNAGEDFTLAVTVRNSNDNSVLLNSVLIDGKTMDAVAVNGSDPAYTQVIPVQQSGDFLRYDFQQPIPANDSLVLTFALNARKPGTYQGQVQVCTKTSENCTLHPWMLIVK